MLVSSVEDMRTGDSAEDRDLVADAQKLEREAYESADSKVIPLLSMTFI